MLQRLACSPPGLANRSVTKPSNDPRSAERCRPLVNVVKLTRILIDACCTNSNLVNSEITVAAHQISAQCRGIIAVFNLFASMLRFSNPFWNTSAMNEGGVYADFVDMV